MAIVDPSDHAVAIQIVYDGPPEAGKTTSIRALARGFGREVYTPEEQDGRTVYFDWLEHVGGRFDGAPIHFLIVTVPGQEHWQHRRAHFLARADVVVFVGDTSARAWPLTLARLADLRARLDERTGTPVGVVFQANRRDAPDAVDRELIRTALDTDRIAVIESVAPDGTGVREAFVFAVRLALDRVRAEKKRGDLLIAAPIQAAEELALLRALEPERAPDPGVPAQNEGTPGDSPLPAPPAADVPSGCVWPPIEGRIVLREAMQGDVGLREQGGSYCAELAQGFLLASECSAVFESPDRARSELVAWARLHASIAPRLSRRRCIVLAEDGHGSYRLWQLIQRAPTLRAWLESVPADEPRTLAHRLSQTCRLLVEANGSWRSDSVALPCTIDTLGVSVTDQPLFVATLPRVLPARTLDPGGIARDLADVLRARTVAEIAQVRDAFRDLGAARSAPSNVAHISELLGVLLDPTEVRS